MFKLQSPSKYSLFYAIHLSRLFFLLQSKRGGGSFTINYYRKDSAFLSLEVPSPTPTC